MAKDAFALSPISARAVQPSEEDYEAISEAFMETARGRWFLGEYAKRNRNADTRMVLDAVARIEQSLAEQKQPPVEDKLPTALTAIKAALDEARDAASAAIDGLALQQSEKLTPVYKATRIIKEISWRWREIGADSRICDLIDQQVAAIEASCGELGSVDPKTALSTAFDLIARRIAQLGEGDDTPAAAARQPVAETAPQAPASAVADALVQAAPKKPESAASEAAEAHIETEQAIAPTEAASEAPMSMAEISKAAISEAADLDVALAPEPIADEVAETAADSVEMSDEAADAHDEAVLDMIALEMAIIDPADEDEEEDQTVATVQPAETASPEMTAPEPLAIEDTASPSEEMSRLLQATVEAAIEEPALAMREIVSPPIKPSRAAPQPMPAPLQQVMEAAAELASLAQLQHSPQALAQAIMQASPEPSLGAAIVASGIIRKPISAADPLASLRRLTQAEKVALFS
jgi:hypothetical protein